MARLVDILEFKENIKTFVKDELANFTNGAVGAGSVTSDNFDEFGEIMAEAIARVVEYIDEEGDGSQPVDV